MADEFVVITDDVRIAIYADEEFTSAWIRPLERSRAWRTLGCWHDFHGSTGYRGGMVCHKRDRGDNVLDWATLEETVAAVVTEHFP